MDLIDKHKNFFSNKLSSILLLIISCLLIGGCTQKEAGGSSEAVEKTDYNKEVIRTIIKKEFNGPDGKYKELRHAVMEAHESDMSQEEYDAFMESPVYRKYTGYMKKTYAPYFTDNTYDTFINSTPAFLYSVFDNDFKLSTKDIAITQHEKEPTLYTFTFQVVHEGAAGEVANFNFEGEALVPEKGKIGRIQFNDIDGLQDRVREQEAF